VASFLICRPAVAGGLPQRGDPANPSWGLFCWSRMLTFFLITQKHVARIEKGRVCGSLGI
jgi:hypothetical protein